MVMENIGPVLEIAHVVPDEVGNMEIAHVSTWVLMVVGNSTAAPSSYSFHEISHFLDETFGKVVYVDDGLIDLSLL